MGFSPQALRDFERIDVTIHRLPPSRLVAGPMELPMMGSAERHRKFVTDLATERHGLRKFQVMRIGRLAVAEQAGLGGNELQVLLVAATRRMSKRQSAAVGGRQPF